MSQEVAARVPPGRRPDPEVGMIRCWRTRRDSTWALHEGEGKRVLRIVNDDGSSSSEVVPAKP
jgi:hypothetical protein